MSLMGIAQFEKFFREAASLDVDKDDLKRFSDFLNQKLYDLLLMGQVVARANGRDVIEFYDLPVTKGLQESIHKFQELKIALALEPILQNLAKLPPLDLEYSAEVELRLPELVGGMAYAVARSFKILDPHLKNPLTQHWEQVEEIFNLLL